VSDETIKAACREWAGIRSWAEPKALAPVKVGDYGVASVETETRTVASRQDGRRRNTAIVNVPNGGLNRWTAEELRSFASRLLEMADQMDARDVWLDGKE
jgi:hypothetical protein